MTRLLLLPLLLAGCGTGLIPPAGSCEAAANDDARVKAIIIKQAGNPHAQLEGQNELRAAKQDATLACLRSRGVIRRGGVERQRPLD